MMAHQKDTGMDRKGVSSSFFSAKKTRLAKTRTPMDMKRTSRASSL